MSVLTVDDLRDHLNMTSTGDEEELQQHLDAAEAFVAGRCGPLGEGSVTIKARERRGVLVLDRLNLAAISQVRNPDGEVVAVEARDTNLRAGILSVTPAGRGDWEVDATATAMPADLRLAVLIIAGHLWETQRGRSQRPGMLRPEDGTVTVAGFAIPNRAAELMAAHVLPTVA